MATILRLLNRIKLPLALRVWDAHKAIDMRVSPPAFMASVEVGFGRETTFKKGRLRLSE